MSCSMLTLAGIAAFTSVFSSFYYVGLVRILYFENPATSMPYVGPFSTLGALIAGFPIVAYPFFPNFVQEFSHTMARSLLFLV